MPDYFLQPGFAWNPLKRHRNLPCPCGSGLKVKRCHGQSETMSLEDAEQTKRWLAHLARAGFIKERVEESSAHFL